MDGYQPDPQTLEKQRKLWKMFGRQTKAGKQLFQMFNTGDKPKLNYPKPRPRSEKEIRAEQEKVTADKEANKKCPQKTVIQYPELDTNHNRSLPTIHPVDLIPKRKPQAIIRRELDQYYARRANTHPINRGVDRANLVKKLQHKFGLQTGVLPKGVSLPSYDEDLGVLDQEKIKKNAMTRLTKKEAGLIKEKPLPPSSPPSLSTQLQQLFDSIVAQIDDRQQYLESIAHLDEPQLKNRIKKEMIERVGELQKLAEMKKGA